MAAVAILIAVALLRYASAQNNTTTLLIPDGLFSPTPLHQTFFGEMTVTSSTTFYTVDCGNYTDLTNLINFWPGPYGCTNNNSYTFSASSAVTEFLLPNYNLGQNQINNTDPVPTWLEAFNQTITIDCGPTNLDISAFCTTTSVYNSEDANDKSIISPTYVTQSPRNVQSSYYPIVFTVPGAAAAAATPVNPTASSTRTSSSGPPTSTNPPAHSTLSTGAKAGIGIGVPIGVFALAGLALLFYTHRRHKQQARLSQMENLVPYDVGSPADFERKDNIVADTSGVYEMQGRQSPVQSPELEG